LLAFLGALSFLIILRMLPADPFPSPGRDGMLVNFRSVFTYFPAIAALLMSVSVSLANEVVNLVFGAWLEDSFALQVTALGSASAVIGLSEVLGESLVSLILDRLGKRRAITLGLLCNSLTSLALPFLGRTVPGAVLGLFIFYLSFEFTFVSMIPMMTEVLPSARATLLAVSMASTSLGRALAAWLASILYQAGFTTSALAAALINLLALLALQFVSISPPNK
jgi:predicted MFS family arabinose efflux permease